MILSAANLYKSYGDLAILKDVSLEIASREIVSIVGSSGAGKSTLLHILGTLDRADAGSVRYGEVEVQQLGDNKLSRFRNQHIGFIFQFHQLLPEFTAVENAMMPALIAGKSKKEAQEIAAHYLERLGLSERIHHKPQELSGGEQQRVAVARSLINSPQIIFADEPSGNLDSANSEALHQLFFELRDELGIAFVIVTHNEKLAVMADRKLTMSDGQFVD